MTRINVKIKAGQETELNGAGPDIPESAMEQLEAQLDKLAEGDILILAGSIPSSLPQTTYERLLARLEGHGVHTVVDATRDLLVNVLQYHPSSSSPMIMSWVRSWAAPSPPTPTSPLPPAPCRKRAPGTYW